MSTFPRRQWPGLGLAILLLVTWIAYRPGLSGGFLFDDYVNLDALGNSGPVDNWRTFWRFLTSGTADPLGRPLSLLSFLIDARDWPADPAPFLRTSLLLHLLNGALLFVWLRSLGRVLDADDARNDGTALLATGIWLMHPLFVSTTLYIVQREAMLPATFTLLGLLAWTHGRVRFARSAGAQGAGWMLGGVLAGTPLAMLCKANGALLPMLVWVIEATVFRRDDASPTSAAAVSRTLLWMTRLLLILPSAGLFVYVAQFAMHWSDPLGTRPWTIGQRLLTEGRVLADYLDLLVVPRSMSTGVFNDGYAASRDLWHPASTLPALLLVLGLVALGFFLRRRAPALAAALLFFFAGHLLESTTLPLELYFEHRNYLPALLLGWPLARALCGWKAGRPLRLAAIATLLAIYAITTWQRADLWGKPDQLAKIWAKQNPESSRAPAANAIAELKAGLPAKALAELEPLWRQRPHDLQIGFNIISAACATRGLTAEDKRALSAALRYPDKNVAPIYHWFGDAIEVAASGRCPGLGLDDIQSWLDAALQNPAIGSTHVRGEDVEPLLAQIGLKRRQPELALLHYDRALATRPSPDVAARQASLLANSDYYEQALAHLDAYERLKDRVSFPGFGMPWLHAKVLQWEGYWPQEMAILREKLHRAIAERDAAAQGAH